MRIVRLALMLATGFVTAFGYATMYNSLIVMDVEWARSEFARQMLIGIAVLCYVLTLIGLWLAQVRGVRERQNTIAATLFGYLSLVCATIVLYVHPWLYSTAVKFILVGYFSIPFFVSVYFLSDDKYDETVVA